MRLSEHARVLIADPDNEVFVSVASVWEIAIKYPLARGGPNDLRISAKAALHYFQQAGCTILEISLAHMLAVEELPRLHGDPFDRMLVAQALATPLRLLTHDVRVARYSDTVIEV